MLKTLFTGFGGNFVENAFANLDITVMDILQIVVSVICMSMIPRLWEEGEKTTLPIDTMQGKSVYMQRISTCVYFTLAVAFCWLALASSSDVSGFAYFQF